MSIKKNNSPSNRIDPLQFDCNLREETRLLKNWFDQSFFEEGELEAGTEIEFFILNRQYKPESKNLELVDEVSCHQLVTECGSAQLEINSSHHPLTFDCFTKLHQNILNIWLKTNTVAARHQYHLALIGSMPISDDLHHKITYLTKSKRYQVMHEHIAALRQEKPFTIKLDGHDKLLLNHPLSMCVGGLISSLQFHLKVPLSQSVCYYNTVQALSAPMLALCANSPYFNGQNIWSETRIFLYEQLFLLADYPIDSKPVDSFGKKYLSNSLFDLFEENLSHYPRLLTEISPDSQKEHLFHVRRQNGTIYRWNRPVIDFCGGKPHLRVEHRGPSTGPTVIDMVSNAAFFYGIVHYFASEKISFEHLLPFQYAKYNFYQAARYGLYADLKWFNGRNITACDLLKELVPLARKGLLLLKIAKGDIDTYLNIVEQRLLLNQNGATWQCAFIKKYGPDFSSMLRAYVQNQQEETPIAHWKI